MSRVSPDPVPDLRRYLSAQLLWGHQVATRLGLGISEFAALNLIALDESVTTGRLAQATGLSAPAATRLVDRLVERGYVERRPDPSDRRKVLVSYTELWQAEIDAAVDPHRQAMRTVLGQLHDAERAAVFGYFAAMGAALSERLSAAANDTGSVVNESERL